MGNWSSDLILLLLLQNRRVGSISWSRREYARWKGLRRMEKRIRELLEGKEGLRDRAPEDWGASFEMLTLPSSTHHFCSSPLIHFCPDPTAIQEETFPSTSMSSRRVTSLLSRVSLPRILEGRMSQGQVLKGRNHQEEAESFKRGVTFDSPDSEMIENQFRCRL